MCRIFKPNQSFARRVDSVEIPGSQHGGSLLVVPSQEKKDRHAEIRVYGQSNLRLFGPHMIKGKPVALPEFDEVKQIDFVGV